MAVLRIFGKEKIMNSKTFGSLALASIVAISANAADVSSFGHIGTAYGSKTYGSATGRAGIEIGMGALSIGFGAAGAIPYAIRGDDDYKSWVKNYAFDTPSSKQWYNWISDAYFRVDTAAFSFAGGRYDTTTFFRGKDGKTHTGVDWFMGQNEGASFKFDTRYFAWWGLYSYETMNFGMRNPDRLGSDLMGFQQYHRSGQYVSTGFDINIKEMVYIDPFVNYAINDKYFQTGLKLQLNLGRGTLKSKTIFRGMYQHAEYSNATTNTSLFWVDQEFLVSNLFKFGGGGYYVSNGDAILDYFGNNTRFYGNTFGENASYFRAGSGVWYVFTGLEHKYFLLDLLYAWKDGSKNGSYQEISAIGQGNIYFGQKVVLGIGGGWIKSNVQNQGVAFVKLSF